MTASVDDVALRLDEVVTAISAPTLADMICKDGYRIDNGLDDADIDCSEAD